MKTFKRTHIIMATLVAFIALTAACGGNDSSEAAASKTEAAKPAASGTAVATADYGKAPDFDLLDLDGNHVRLSDFAGEVVIVDFWATWCPPCKKAMPHLQEIHETYGEKGVNVLAISTDREGPKVVRPYIEKNGFTFTVLLMDQRVHLDFGGVQSIPTTFIISPEGKIVEKFVGYRDLDVYLAAIEKART